MDLTAFGPYALNVRTNISSYGPRARLLKAYYPHQLMLALHLFGYVICCSFMFVNKRTVLNENCVCVHCSMDRKERERNLI